jgi:hypothetical protein
VSIASDLFRTVTVKIHDISQQLPYIVVNQADDNGKIISSHWITGRRSLVSPGHACIILRDPTTSMAIT